MEPRKAAETRLRANMLEAQIMAALGGHQLQPWEAIDENSLRYQAHCSLCNKVIFVSSQALYSLLADTCPTLDFEEER